MTSKQQPIALRSARSYWRLAAKARRAGNYKQGDHWQGVGDRRYQEYLRQQEAADARRQLVQRVQGVKLQGGTK
jgi:hypothetical protein